MTLTESRPTPAAEGGDVPVVEVEDLRVVLNSGSGPVTLVDNISYSVLPGRAVALVGESGAGKSISCRAALDLLNRRKFTVTGRVGSAESR